MLTWACGPFLESDLSKAWASLNSAPPAGAVFCLGQGARQGLFESWVERPEPEILVLTSLLARQAGLGYFLASLCPAAWWAGGGSTSPLRPKFL